MIPLHEQVAQNPSSIDSGVLGESATFTGILRKTNCGHTGDIAIDGS